MTIVSLRGTHGSGKSSVVKAILNKYKHYPVEPNKRGRPEGYLVELPSGTLFIRGPYHTACGGCDAIQPYANIWPYIDGAMKDGPTEGGGVWYEDPKQGRLFANPDHCLFEGALVSSGYGNLGRSTEKYGDDVVFAFLDTPLDTCLDRIAQRRAARWLEKQKPGLPPPVNPTNTASKHVMVEKSIKSIAALGRRTAIIDHRKPVQQVLRLFGVRITKEPT